VLGAGEEPIALEEIGDYEEIRRRSTTSAPPRVAIANPNQ
jgi:hypothetical protein